MRNLKRALSLGLTAAMISGLMVMGSSAASYADVTSENNVEAIEVLESVGIMIGDESGNFNPDQNVTRNEMAVVMANLMEYNVASYKDTSPFTDVPSWAEPYVAACWTNGITAGYSDTIYGGSDTVTTAQAALMLMKALGYFQYSSDFGGDWQLATTRQGNAIDLFNGVDSGVTQAMTRNDVAQLVLNTLRAGTVTASTDGSWTIGDVTINNNVQYSYVTSNQTYATAIDDARSTSNTTDANRSIVELGEQLYMGDLKLNDNSIDNFGRPARTWSYDGKEVGTYAKTELLVESYTTAVTGREMFDLLTASTINDNDVVRYVDGVGGDMDKSLLARNNKNDLANTGNGALTEVYLDDDNDEVTIATINTYLAQATGDYSDDKEYAPLEVYWNMKVNGGHKDVSAKVYNVDVDDVAAVSNVVDEQFYLVNISYRDDDDGEITDIMDAEVMENSTVTKWSDSDTKVVDKLTVDGTQYNAAVKAFFDEDTLEDYDLDLLTDMTYTLYLDQYGYVIGVDVYEGDLKYVFITGYDMNRSNLSVSTADAGAIFLDGTMDKIEVNVKDTNENIEDYDGDNDAYYDQWDDHGYDGYPVLNRWYRYSVNESGVYTLKPVDMTATLYNGEDETIDTANVSVRDNVLDTKTRVYGEDASVFITVDTDVVDTTGKDQIAITDVDGLYTGVQSVDLEIDNAPAVTGDDFDFEAQVYTVYDKDNYIIGAVVLGEASGDDNYAYIVSNGATSEEKIGDTYYWEFDAILDGELQTLTAKSKYHEIIDTIKANRWNPLELRFDSDNYVIKVVDPDKVEADALPEDAQIIYGYNDATEPTVDIEDYNVYFVDSDDFVKDEVNNPLNKDMELKLQGRTLYITPDQVDMGLAIASDAKAVVIQDENKKTDVKTEFDSVSAAISHLADPYKDTTALEYNGKIFAVLNDNGTAAWVVFDSRTALSTGDGGIIIDDDNAISNRDGNVTLYGSDDTTKVNGVSISYDTDTVTYTFYALDADGDEISRDDVTYDIRVEVNGQEVNSDEAKAATTNGSGMVTGSISPVAATADDYVLVEVSNVEVVPEEPPVPSTTEVVIDGINIYTANEDSNPVLVGNAIQKALEDKGYTNVTYDIGVDGSITNIKAMSGGGTISFKYGDDASNEIAFLEDGESIAAAVSNGAETIYLTDGEFKMSSKVEGDLTIIGDEDTVIVSTSENTAEDTGLYVTTGDLVVENVTFKGTGNGIVTVPGFTGTVTIRNCTFDGVNNGIYLNGCAGGVISGCVFKDVKHSAIGIDTLTGTLTLSNKDYGTAGACGGDIEAFNDSEDKLVYNDGAVVIDK